MYVSLKRDLARDIRAIVDQEIDRSGDTYIAAVVAGRVVAKLRDEDPELLTKFLDQHAVPIITRMVADISRAQKTYARNNSNRKLFSEAADRQERGEPRAVAAWLDTLYVVTIDQQRKRLRDMDKDDLEFAINDYTERARVNALQAAFLRALAKRIGARTVGEMYSDEELSTMWNSVQ
jgi:hypothetical protein